MNNHKNNIIFNFHTPEEEAFVVKKLTIPFTQQLKSVGTIFTLPRHNIEEEYDKSALQSFTKKLEQAWHEREHNFITKVSQFFNTPITDPFLIHITNYGPMGHYLYPTRHIFINRSIEDHGFDAVRTIKHEIIHLIIEPFIQKYKISQVEKEKLVNVIADILETPG